MPNKIWYEKLFDWTNLTPSKDWLLAIDPSGNVKQGKGNIGIVVFDIRNCRVLKVETIKLMSLHHRDYVLSTQLDSYIKDNNVKRVVVENFVSYGQTHIGVEAETKFVVDYITQTCRKHSKNYYTPNAVMHKSRFTKQRLKNYKVDLKKLKNNHELDALKIALYDYMFQFGKHYFI